MTTFKPSKTRILMVYLGNICRSPLAQGILESKLSSDSFFIDSAGTASYHIGGKPDKRSIEVAKKNNIDISNQRARQFIVDDFENFDIIFTMDQSNYNDIINLSDNNVLQSKVELILVQNPSISSKNVPDPYYGGDSGFEDVYNMLNETCDIIAKNLLEQN